MFSTSKKDEKEIAIAFFLETCTQLFKQILRHGIQYTVHSGIGNSFAENYFRSVKFNREWQKCCKTTFYKSLCDSFSADNTKNYRNYRIHPVKWSNPIIRLLSYHFRRWRRVPFISGKFQVSYFD